MGFFKREEFAFGRKSFPFKIDIFFRRGSVDERGNRKSYDLSSIEKLSESVSRESITQMTNFPRRRGHFLSTENILSLKIAVSVLLSPSKKLRKSQTCQRNSVLFNTIPRGQKCNNSDKVSEYVPVFVEYVPLFVEYEPS